MSDMPPVAPDNKIPPAPPDNETLPQALISQKRQFQFIWLIPIVAVLIAGFLGWRALHARGPMVTLSFSTADGLVAGQTKVRHKAVDLGTVETIILSPDRRRVMVGVRMQRDAIPYLTEKTRFWVVRPRFSLSSVSGLDTLLSGAYIGLDPGAEGGEETLVFVGLEEPPAIRSDEPGRTFKLTAARIGAISSGSPLSYRDIPAGEVLGYELGPNGDSLTVNVFIRHPFDDFVHAGTKFWNSSGITLNLGANGVNLRLDSLQALLSGDIAFDTTEEAQKTPTAIADSIFPLFNDAASAANAGYKRQVPFLIYFTGTSRGLAVGAPVETLGQQVGSVTGIRLIFNPENGELPKIAVRIELQPERLMRDREIPDDKLFGVVRALVAKGMRAQLRTANYLTGQMLVGLDLAPDAPAAEASLQDGVIVLPSVEGSFDGIIASVGHLADNLAALPLDQIAKNLSETLASAKELTGSPALRDALQNLSATLADAQVLIRQVSNGVTPVLKRLPDLAKSMQETIDRTGKLVAAADKTYVGDSSFKRDMERLMSQLSEAARSIRVLADYLDQHPSALLRGRTGSATENGDK
jgi:paraquat-inducible protein B